MSLMTGAQALAYARLLTVDADTNNQGLVDQNYYDLMSEFLHSFAITFDLSVLAEATFTIANGASSSLAKVFAGDTVKDVLTMTATVGGVTTPLEKKTVQELRELQLNGGAANSTPIAWAWERVADLGNTLNFYFYPTANATITLQAYTQVYPTDVASGTTIPLQDAQARWIARMAAAEAARIIGRDANYVAEILKPIPEYVQQMMKLNQNVLMPRNAPQKKPA